MAWKIIMIFLYSFRSQCLLLSIIQGCVDSVIVVLTGSFYTGLYFSLVLLTEYYLMLYNFVTIMDLPEGFYSDLLVPSKYSQLY